MITESEFDWWTYRSTLFMIIAAGALLLGMISERVFSDLLRQRSRNALGWISFSGAVLLCLLGLVWNAAPKLGFWGLLLREVLIFYVGAYIFGAILDRDLRRSDRKQT